MSSKDKDRIVLTFALSPRGMANSTEMNPNVRPKTQVILLELRELSIRGMRLMAVLKRGLPR